MLYSKKDAFNKKGRRIYPISDNPMQIKPGPQRNSDKHHHDSLPLLPIEPALHSSKQPIVNRNFDVPFLGNPPLVQDLDLPPPTPRLPLNASFTSSEFSQCDVKYQRCSLNAIPYSANMLKKTKLPLSLLIEPYPRNSEKDPLPPLINNSVINRCKRCKSFINPFIQFVDDGTKWKCNICLYAENQAPPSYSWNHIICQQVDRWSVPELNYGCVDYLATTEFLAKPPQPPVYVFVIDISSIAIETGMINVFAEALIECIDQIPNDDERTRIGFITTGHAIGFYSLVNQRPEWLMIPDIDDVYLPRVSTDLIVNLTEAKSVANDLLARLKTMFQKQSYVNNNNCLGSALKAARQLLSTIGGKIICLQASLPNIGIGALPLQRKKRTTTGDSLLLEPASDFYRAFSEECVRSHICADMFVFGSQDIDVATLNIIPRFTGGQTYYYPGFNAKNVGDREKFKQEIQKLVQENMGLEAIIRTRCSPGLGCKSFHGNFSLQSPDILVLPNVPRDGSYCIDLTIESELHGDLAYVQTCMLYTSTKGERLIRVMTTCLPVARNISKVFYNADQVSIARSIMHQAIDKAVTLKIRDAKEYVVQQTTALCKAFSKEVIGVAPIKSQQLTLCRSLSMIPALTLSLLKSEAINDSGVVPVNISTQSGILMRTLPTSLWCKYTYPTLFSLHNMPIQSGTFDSDGTFVMPPRLNLSSERLERHGCYLLENGQRILLWIGKSAVPQLYLDLFGVSDKQSVVSEQYTSFPILDNPFSKKVNRIIQHIQNALRYSNFYPTLYVVKEEEGSMLHNWFMTHLLEEQHQPVSSQHKKGNMPNSTIGYYQWLSFLKDSI